MHAAAECSPCVNNSIDHMSHFRLCVLQQQCKQSSFQNSICEYQNMHTKHVQNMHTKHVQSGTGGDLEGNTAVVCIGILHLSKAHFLKKSAAVDCQTQAFLTWQGLRAACSPCGMIPHLLHIPNFLSLPPPPLPWPHQQKKGSLIQKLWGTQGSYCRWLQT